MSGHDVASCMLVTTNQGRPCAGCNCICHDDPKPVVDPRNLKAVLLELHDRLVKNCRYSPRQTRGGKSAEFIRRFAEQINSDSTIRLVLEEMGLSWPMPSKVDDVARFGEDRAPGEEEA